MKDSLCTDFQEKVNEVLVRHINILDIITKYSQTSAVVNRAVIKSVTDCGCISIDPTKSNIPLEINYSELSNYKKSHVIGELCPICKEKIEEEIGNNLFYLAALCNDLNINLYDSMLKEYEKINTLGKFSLY